MEEDESGGLICFGKCGMADADNAGGAAGGQKEPGAVAKLLGKGKKTSPDA